MILIWFFIFLFLAVAGEVMKQTQQVQEQVFEALWQEIGRPKEGWAGGGISKTSEFVLFVGECLSYAEAGSSVEEIGLGMLTSAAEGGGGGKSGCGLEIIGAQLSVLFGGLVERGRSGGVGGGGVGGGAGGGGESGWR